MNDSDFPVPTPPRSANARIAARSRAERRLRRITVGTAMAAVVATGGLSLVAALSYDGHTTQATTAAAVTTTGESSESSERSTSTSTSGTTSTSATRTTTPTVTSSRSSAHATSGGS